MVNEIEGDGATDFAQVREANGALASLLGLSEGGQEQGRQNGDDGNDDEEFDQGEGWGVAR